MKMKYQGEPGTGKNLGLLSELKGLANTKLAELPFIKPTKQGVYAFQIKSGPEVDELYNLEVDQQVEFVLESDNALPVFPNRVACPYHLHEHYWIITGKCVFQDDEYHFKASYAPTSGEGYIVLGLTYHDAVTYNPYLGEKPRLTFDPVSLLIFAILRGFTKRYDGPAIIFVDEANKI